MIKTLKIEGMSCMHCAGAVTKALNALSGVSATVDLNSKTATIEMSEGAVSEEALRSAIEDAGYEVIG